MQTLCSETCRVSCFEKFFDDPFVSCTALFWEKTELTICMFACIALHYTKCNVEVWDHFRMLLEVYNWVDGMQ